MNVTSQKNILRIFSIIFLATTCLVPYQMARAESTAPAQGATTIYMPVVSTPPRALPYQFVTSNSCEGEYEGELNAAPVTLSYGFKRLGYGTTVLGAVGMTWREEWIADGQVIDVLTTSGTVTEADELITSSIVFGENGNCGDAVPRGQWVVRFFLDNRLAQEAVVTIR